MTLNSSYTEYLNQKLSDVNEKLISTIGTEMSNLKTDEKILLSAMELKARQDVIEQIKRDIEIEELRKQNRILRNSINLNSSLARTVSNVRSRTSHNLLHYLEKDHAIETLKTLNDSLQMKTNLLLAKQEPLSTTALNDMLVKQALINDNLRTHLLVHKPNEDCSICSPNNNLLGSLRHNNNNLRTYLQNTIKENKVKTEALRAKPNVIFTKSKNFKKSQPLSYSEYLKLFDADRAVSDQNLTRPLTYDKSFYQTRPATTSSLNKSINNSLNRSLSRSDLYDRNYVYDMNDDETVYRHNKYYNKFHEFNSTQKSRKDDDLRSRSMNKSYSMHEKPWSYGKVETPHYEYTNLRLKK